MLELGSLLLCPWGKTLNSIIQYEQILRRKKITNVLFILHIKRIELKESGKSKESEHFTSGISKSDSGSSSQCIKYTTIYRKLRR